MNIESYLDIIKIDTFEKNPNIKNILHHLNIHKNLDAISYILDTNSKILNTYINYIDIIQNLNKEGNIYINNYKLNYKEYFPLLIFKDINISIENTNSLLFKSYTLNSVNKLEFDYYNKIYIDNKHGLKIKNSLNEKLHSIS